MQDSLEELYLQLNFKTTVILFVFLLLLQIILENPTLKLHPVHPLQEINPV